MNKKEIIEKSKTLELNFKQYVFLPSQVINHKLGLVISCHYDEYDKIAYGYIDECNEFITCEKSDSSAVKISWWDGSNTKERYVHDDDCTYPVLAHVHNKTYTKGTYQSYTDYYIDDDNNVYFTETDNNQQNIDQCMIELD